LAAQNQNMVLLDPKFMPRPRGWWDEAVAGSLEKENVTHSLNRWGELCVHLAWSNFLCLAFFPVFFLLLWSDANTSEAGARPGTGVWWCCEDRAVLKYAKCHLRVRVPGLQGSTTKHILWMDEYIKNWKAFSFLSFAGSSAWWEGSSTPELHLQPRALFYGNRYLMF
jgi:hypothetical protein